MFIKNKAIRKLEAKRLYLNDFSLAEITERVGSSLIELDNWRSEEGWDEERKILQEGRQNQKTRTLAHLNMLLELPLSTETLTEIILHASFLEKSEITEIAQKILNKAKGHDK